MPPLPWGKSDVHGVGRLTAGEFGWLVTAVMVADQFAAAAMPSSSVPGIAARARKPGSRRGSTVTSTNGSASRTSGCTATAAPMSQPDRWTRDWASARMPNRNSPVATASSGCPNLSVRPHRAVAPAAARSNRLSWVAPRCSASASAASRATDAMATSYGPASSHTAGCGFCGPASCSERPAVSAMAATGMRITAAPGKLISSVGAVYRPPMSRCSSRWAAASVRHKSSGSPQSGRPASAAPHVDPSIPTMMRPSVASSGQRLRLTHRASAGTRLAWSGGRGAARASVDTCKPSRQPRP